MDKCVKKIVTADDYLFGKNVQKIVTPRCQKTVQKCTEDSHGKEKERHHEGCLILYVRNQIQGSSTLWVTTDPGSELFGVSDDGAAAVEDDG